MTDLLLYSARQCAEVLGIDESTFNRMIADGRIPARIRHPATFGQGKCRKYSRVLLEKWAAGEPIETDEFEPLDLTSSPSVAITRRASPAVEASNRTAATHSPGESPTPGSAPTHTSERTPTSRLTA